MVRGYLTPVRRSGLGRQSFGAGSLFNLHSQMNRLFDDLFDQDAQGPGHGIAGRMGFPALDITDEGGRIEISAELPGVKEADIDLNIEDGVLTLCGEKKSSRTDDSTGYSERSYGRFERRIALPANIDDEACDAEFTDGVLKITIPKSEEKTRGRRIPVGGASAGGQNPEDALIEQEDGREVKQRTDA